MASIFPVNYHTVSTRCITHHFNLSILYSYSAYIYKTYLFIYEPALCLRALPIQPIPNTPIHPVIHLVDHFSLSFLVSPRHSSTPPEMPHFNLLLAPVLLTASLAAGLNFTTTTLSNPDGSTYQFPFVTTSVIAPSAPHLLVAASFLGELRLLHLDRTSRKRYVVRSVAYVTTVPDGRFVTGMIADPFDPTAFLLSTAVHDFASKGLNATDWDNGQIDIFRLHVSNKTIIFERTLVSGLPLSATASNTGPYGLAVELHRGALFIAQAAVTNGGAPDMAAGHLDTIVTGAMLKVDVRAEGKTRKLIWKSKTNPMRARLRDPPAVTGIAVYAIGLRSAFQLLLTRRNHLLVVDGGANVGRGERALSCSASIPFTTNEPDRLIEVRRGKWYGMANHARALKDARQCRYSWLPEAGNTTKIPGLANVIMSTLDGINDGTLGSGTVGFAQYTASWDTKFRGTLLGAEFDLTTPTKGRPSPILFAFDLPRKQVRKVADAPGTNIAQDAYGALLITQLNLGRIAMSVPILTRRMKKRAAIRMVWPSAAKAGSLVHVVGTGFSKKISVFIGGVACGVKRHRLRYGFLHDVSCVVPERSATRRALHVRVGDAFMKSAFTILSGDIRLAK